MSDSARPSRHRRQPVRSPPVTASHDSTKSEPEPVNPSLNKRLVGQGWPAKLRDVSSEKPGEGAGPSPDVAHLDPSRPSLVAPVLRS